MQNLFPMKSSTTQESHREMIINVARFSRRKIGTGYVSLDNKLKTHEIEQVENDTKRDDYSYSARFHMTS
jgi:hypothetical protein